MKEELSLTRAKQYYRRNIWKYGADQSFECAILEYYLRSDEVEKLYKYAMDHKELIATEAELNIIERKYQEYRG